VCLTELFDYRFAGFVVDETVDLRLDGRLDYFVGLVVGDKEVRLCSRLFRLALLFGFTGRWSTAFRLLRV
jgi:hypothetical protein